VLHALDALKQSGWVPDYVALLQPTSPLRRARHVAQAVGQLRESGADSVVTVVELPRQLSPDYVMKIEDGVLRSFLPDGGRVTRRQDARPAYSREGTVYAFRRDALERFGNIYGERCLPLLIDAKDSLSIDSPEDWDRAEAILSARPAGSGSPR
jgi:CMP-N-acetylneuraminic acid synthetase